MSSISTKVVLVIVTVAVLGTAYIAVTVADRLMYLAEQAIIMRNAPTK